MKTSIKNIAIVMAMVLIMGSVSIGVRTEALTPNNEPSTETLGSGQEPAEPGALEPGQNESGQNGETEFQPPEQYPEEPPGDPEPTASTGGAPDGQTPTEPSGSELSGPEATDPGDLNLDGGPESDGGSEDDNPGGALAEEYAEQPAPWMFGNARRSMSLLSSGTPSAKVVDPDVVSESQLAPGQVRMTKTAAPVAGKVNTWDITLRVAGRPQQVTSDIVVVIDVSGSMGYAIDGMPHDRLYYAKEAASNFVTTVLAADPQNTKISIVSFSGYNSSGSGNTATIRQGLTNDEDDLHLAINGLSVAGSGTQYTHTQSGIAKAREVLASASSTATKKTIVLFSDGLPNRNFSINTPVVADFYSGNQSQRLSRKDLAEGRFNYGNSLSDGDVALNTGTGQNPYRYYYSSPNSAIAEGAIARGKGYTVYAIGMYAGNEGQQTLYEIADPGKSYASDAAGLNAVFQQIAGQLGSPVSTASITDPMASGFIIADTGTISKTGGTTVYDGDTNTLSWNFPLLTQSGEGDIKYEQLTYRIVITESTPYVTGNTLLPTNGTTPMSFTDVEGKASVNNFSIPQVDPVFVTLDKVVLDSSGNPVSSTKDFTITIDNVNYVIKADDPIKVIKKVWNVGNYLVSETADPNYVTSYLVNSAATQQLTLAQAGADQNVVVTNKMRPPSAIDVEIEGEKTLTGRTLADEEFEFKLYSSTASGTEGALLDSVKNIGGGFTFERTFTAAGTYYYLVKETVGTLGGVTYDLTEYLVKIVISDNLAGALVQTSLDVMVFDTETDEWVESALVFDNSYSPRDIEVEIEGEKTLTGRTLADEEFEFKLYSSTASGTEGALLDTVKNIGGGFTFERTFTAAGTYYYLVKETVGTLGGVTYDLTEYLVKIVISDNLAGALAQTSLDVMVFDTETDEWVESALVFDNSYSPRDIEVEIEGEKTLTGRTLADEEFEFKLYSSTASGTEGALLDTVKNIGGGFTFERTFTAAGTYYYLVKETVGTLGGVTYDLTEYLVKIVISDNLAGALVQTSLDVMVFDTETEAWIESHLAFKNKYTPPTVLVPDIEVKKSVAEEIFSEAGDELHYSFTVTNTGDLAFVKLIVNDPRLGIVDLEIDLSTDPLLPGETYTHVFTEPYIVTDADVDAKAPIINTITVVGETAQGIKAEDEDSVTVPFEQTEPHIPPIISLVKKVKEDSFSKAGDLLHYYFTVTNEGVVPIVKLTLNDPKLGIKNVVIDISATPLMPGESYTYAFSEAYVVTEADVANGKIVNVLTVKGETVEGAEVEVKDDLTTPMEQIQPHIPATGEYFNHWAAIAALLLGGAVALIAIMRRRKSH